jgi:hypothetical protein
MPKAKKEPIEDGAPAAEETTKDPIERLDDLEVSIKELARNLQDMKGLVEDALHNAPKASVSKEFEDVVPQSDKPVSDDPIENAVLTELSSEFTVEKKVHAPGVSFKLIIRAPERLRDSVDDFHVKVIPYLEAEIGAREYAKKVKKWHIERAGRKGLGSVFN